MDNLKYLGYLRIHIVTPQLETPRLLLHQRELEDSEQVQILFPQWEIVRFLTKQIPWPYHPDGAISYYRQSVLPTVELG